MENFEKYLEETGEIGYVSAINQFLVSVRGLPGVKPKEVILTERGQQGIVQTILAETVEVLMLDVENLSYDLKVARTNQKSTFPASEELLGRIVDPLGRPLDGGRPIGGYLHRVPLEAAAPQINRRARVTRPLETGVAIVDLLAPLGYGQRELVIGDKKTGKTIFLCQTMVSQASRGIVCVYVSIGKRKSDVKNVENYLKKMKAIENCVLLVASSSDPPSLVYLAPFAGLSIAEFFRDSGRDVLIIFDDLTNHAKFYREISLISKKAPGRGSYPGDIFHLHAALLERAASLKKEGGKTVSITALPVAETLEGDLTGYIQTNLMAITDGHIFFDREEFEKGMRPAINHSLSVSRVGNQTKSLVEKELAAVLQDALVKYRKAQEIARFGIDLPEQTKKEIDLGEKIDVILEQDVETLIERYLQLVFFGLLFGGFWEGKDPSLVKVDLVKIMQKHHDSKLKDLKSKIEKAGNLEELLLTVNGNTLKID